LKVFCDPSFRILLITTITDPVLLQYNYGKEKADELLQAQNKLVRKNIAVYNGSEAEHSGNGFIVSFNSAMEAVTCALTIMQDTLQADADMLGFKMSITGGEPIEKSNDFFGDAIQSGRYLCAISKFSRLAIDSSVKQLVAKDQLNKKNEQFHTLDPNDESLLQMLFSKLEENWQDAGFDVEDFGRQMAMSKSQLYRKTMTLTGFSPNLLVKEFRLEKAKEAMKEKRYTISQITFDSGFTSPSYFTKCFKKKYGLLPNSYMELLH
jgi:AraC-like DNA-binding protein